MTELTRLSDITVHGRCPKCGRSSLARNTVQQTEVASNHASLWTLSQSCIVCGWETTHENVKLGA